MAQKNVLVRDGADELLPKTSASMVFTESGQTVENALKNAGGGGGTGDSGIVDITSIISKLDLTNGGTMDSTDLSTLKGYMSAGRVLKATIGGVTLLFNYDTSSSTIVMTSAPVVSVGMYGAMVAISFLIDANTGEYIGTNNESSGKLVNQIIPSNYTATKICQMNGYTKPSSYAAITPEDTIDSAIGKLEAGIGSGGAGGGGEDDVYYLPEGLYNLNELSTEEEVNNALNGTENDIISAISSGKRLYIRKSGTIGVFSTPVTGYVFVGSVWSISFIVKDSGLLPEIHTIYSTKNVRISYVSGYKNPYLILADLIGNEDSDSILRVFGDFDGFMKLVKNINDENIIKTSTTSGYIILSAEAKEEDNGDISVSLSGIGPNLWGGYGGVLTVNYTKSSNTFSCTVTPISMGS